MGILRTPEITAAYRVESPHGIFYVPQSHIGDPVVAHIASGILFEEPVIRTCLQYITPGSTVIDVGCNFGQMTIQFSKAVGPLGTVHGIESSSFIIDYTRRSVNETTGCTNVVLHHAAAWNRSKLIKHMYLPTQGGSWSGAGLGLKEHSGEDHDWENVETLAIDDMKLTSPVSLIKIDIQGADWHALAGAKNVILRDRPTVIFEYEHYYDEIFGKTLDDYRSFLTDVGYEIIGSVDNNQHDFICRPQQ